MKEAVGQPEGNLQVLVQTAERTLSKGSWNPFLRRRWGGILAGEGVCGKEATKQAWENGGRSGLSDWGFSRFPLLTHFHIARGLTGSSCWWEISPRVQILTETTLWVQAAEATS